MHVTTTNEERGHGFKGEYGGIKGKFRGRKENEENDLIIL